MPWYHVLRRQIQDIDGKANSEDPRSGLIRVCTMSTHNIGFYILMSTHNIDFYEEISKIIT